MSSFVGASSSAYESIAPYRLYLDLGTDDIEFVSGKRSAIALNEDNLHKPKPQETPIEDVLTLATHDILTARKDVSNFNNFIKRFKLEKLLHHEFTIFIPINKSIQNLVDFVNSTVAEPSDILKYHMLDYVLIPVQLFNRKLKLETKLKGQYIVTDGPSILLPENGKLRRNKILESIETANGFIYIIDEPLLPYLY